MKNVLVVDDDPDIRKMVCTMLARLDYRCVAQATGGNQALHILPALLEELEGRRQALDLVLSDFEMPNGNGLELTRELKGFHPPLRVILMSGTLALPGNAAREEFPPLLQKPFTSSVLKEALDARPWLATPPHHRR